MNNGIVSTIHDKCKRCYSCIRECPAKAIKVINGQAAVISDRCIVCGHCVKVCSQHSKKIRNDIDVILNSYINRKNTIAIVAPSFAASFPESYFKFPSALRKLGFNQVVETAFGADLVSNNYLDAYLSDDKKTIITSSCPAVVNYIEKYFQELVPHLAKIVSPMIALGKYLKSTLGEDIKVVFIGPCIAKKEEAFQEEVKGIIDAVLTFTEIKQIFIDKDIDFGSLDNSDFDPPHAFMGKTYPLAGGLLKTAGISGDLLEKEVIVVEGKKKVVEIIDELSAKEINAKFVDILFCEGCISGPAIESDLNYYSRREKIIKYVEQKLHTTDKQIWKSNLYNSRGLDLSRTFTPDNQRRPVPSEDKIKAILAETNKITLKDELNCGACGYISCREYAVAIAKGLAEKEMCLPYLIDELGRAYEDLKETQEQLHSAEKLASIGQLAAGVAHEINNPLGTILLYSSMLKREIEERSENKQYPEDCQLIIDEAKRCKNIVSNLLNFARQGKLTLKEVDISHLLHQVLRGIKVNPNYNGLLIDHDPQRGFIVEGDEDQLKQVFLNIINNACEAVEETSEKRVSIKKYYEEQSLIIEVTDTGCGIEKENYGKVFTPFFSTKKMGKGTGLGLAITYGIIKMHKGDISFNSEKGKGTTFKIRLPKHLSQQNQLVN